MDDRDIIGLEKIRKDCGICGGKGYSLEVVDDILTINDCECVIAIKDHIKFIDANIPTQYRAWHINALRPDFKKKNEKELNSVFDYIDHIQDNIDGGYGLWLCSPPGLAKSSMITYILRQAIKEGFTAYWGKAHQYINMKLLSSRGDKDAKKLQRKILESVNILAIEEIDKIHMYGGEDSTPKSVMFLEHMFFEFLSDVYDANIPILISSNEHRKVIENKYPTHVRDRLSKVKLVALTGKTGR